MQQLYFEFVERRLCACGCGGFVQRNKKRQDKWSKFLPGHNNKLQGAKERLRLQGKRSITKYNKSRRSRQKTRRLWSDDNWVSKWMEARCKALGGRPNLPESIVDRISSDVVRYTGDGSWWRRLPNGIAKNPDFKVTGQRKVIEVFGEYWHTIAEAEMLIEMFHRVGYECLILWESDIKSEPDNVAEIINIFTGG